MTMKKTCILSAALCLVLTGCSGEVFQDRFPSGLFETPAMEAEQSGKQTEEINVQDKGTASDAAGDSEEGQSISQDHTEEPDRVPAETDSGESEAADSPPEVSDDITVLLNGIVTPGMSEYEKVKAIHDYLIIHVDYDYDNLAAGTLPDTAFTAEGALFLHSAVCEGYARAFSLLCDRSGIENALVYGTADDGTGVQNHAWNQVRVDGEWYNIDVTWDDPLMDGEPVTDGSNMVYDYFLVPDMTLLGNHTAGSPDSLKACTSERYLEENRRLTIAPYLSEPCTFAASDEEAQTAVEQYLADGIRTFEIVCDVTSHSPEGRAELILNHVKAVMEARAQYGQISVETQYGIADYAIIDVTITP